MIEKALRLALFIAARTARSRQERSSVHPALKELTRNALPGQTRSVMRLRRGETVAALLPHRLASLLPVV